MFNSNSLALPSSSNESGKIPGTNRSILRLLRCPFCAGNFRVPEDDQTTENSGYTVLTCSCSRFPVVAGIPIFKRGAIGSAGQTAAQVISLIEAGQEREALLSMVMPKPPPSPKLAAAWIKSLPAVAPLKHFSHRHRLRSWQEKAQSLLLENTNHATARDLLKLYFNRGSGAYNYFAYRFGQPRHLIALSLTTLIHRSSGPILDLACGFGHMTYSLVGRAENQPVIGVDQNFYSLYVAKHRIAPTAHYICSEAGGPLPFLDNTFSTVLCSDAFHYFTDKKVCIGELKRLTRNAGVIILTVLRNSLVDYPYAGQPLSPKGYEELVADIPHCILPDSVILKRYLQKQGPSLSNLAKLDALSNEATLSLVASARQDVFCNHDSFEDWPHAAGQLTVNPLYTMEKRDKFGKVCLRRTFPTSFYEEDNAQCKEYLPEAVSVDSAIFSDLARGERTAEVESLINQCVVLGMPQRYW
jgi:ubiquinone/menaquinone biosynthesis C-methylase UbiE